MRKFLALTICCLLLSGCTTAPAETTVHSETTERDFWGLNIYTPNPYTSESSSTFATAPIVISELSPEIVLNYLKTNSILNEDIEILCFTQEGKHLTIDFNQAFLDQLCSYGTTGEYTFVGCVVNTYLYVYNAETIRITVNGEIMESGHVVYDFPMVYFE